jgi:sulfur-carrier protein
VPHVRLFAQAREAAGTSQERIPGATVAEVLQGASSRFGDHFARVLPTCRVWVNGEPADATSAVTDEDEVAILPPVSGG